MAQAQSQSPWQFRVALYGYLPDVASKSSFPTGRFTPNIEVDASDILKLQGAFMGTFEAQYLQWGLWTDYMYVNIGADKSGTRSLSIGNAGLPAGVSADLHYNVKGKRLDHRGHVSPALQCRLDLRCARRCTDGRPPGDVGLELQRRPRSVAARPLGELERQGEELGRHHRRQTTGRARPRTFMVRPLLSRRRRGDSDFTRQRLAGVGYAFSWGDVAVAWRYLDYHFGSGSSIENAKFSGPLVGVAFRW